MGRKHSRCCRRDHTHSPRAAAPHTTPTTAPAMTPAGGGGFADGVELGDTDMVGVTLGVTEMVGVTLGVTEMVGVTLGVTEMVGDTLGVLEEDVDPVAEGLGLGRGTTVHRSLAKVPRRVALQPCIAATHWFSTPPFSTPLPQGRSRLEVA